MMDLHLSVAHIGREQGASWVSSGYFRAVIGSAGGFLDAKHVTSGGLPACIARISFVFS